MLQLDSMLVVVIILGIIKPWIKIKFAVQIFVYRKYECVLPFHLNLIVVCEIIQVEDQFNSFNILQLELMVTLEP